MVSTSYVKSAQGLFSSGFAPVGTTVPVVGVAKLAAGRYAFYCQPHPNMKGTLIVR